ncbi:conserved hypothetical protein [Flavobacterium psychrophilum]|uniref:hypothetical protein n=1 Tax=Flavobacterium psychrophilum TaxID=96345 RepID=UPI000B7C544C|nr:hypothetical protein [Flavobacterium psychrophilum]SNB29787.1 conserved hypothetical protein [Flavobacterium psychrophilum]
MIKETDISKHYNYHNEEGVLLTLDSDYKLISAEFKSIDVAFENRTIDDIAKELDEICNLYIVVFHNENATDEIDDIEDDEDYIKINFLIAYMENLKLYLQEQHKINTKTHSKC